MERLTKEEVVKILHKINEDELNRYCNINWLPREVSDDFEPKVLEEKRAEGRRKMSALEKAIADLSSRLYSEEERAEATLYTEFAENGWMDHICSSCGRKENIDVHTYLDWNFCPGCGKRIKYGKKPEDAK